MTAPSFLLGLDVGTSRIKALLLDQNGEAAATSVIDTPFTKAHGGVEMTVDSLQAAVGVVLEDLGEELRGVEAVGVAGIAESGAPLDDRGVPLAPIIS